MNDRRRFLHVLGATTAAVALPACGGTDTTTGTGATGTGGEGGGSSTTGGMGGAGGSGGATSTSTTDASSSASTGGSPCEMNPAGIAVGVPADFAMDGLHIVAGSKVLVGRDAKGLYALTSICTHEFCDMDGKQQGQSMGMPVADGIVCLCHHSKFDLSGVVVPQFKIVNDPNPNPPPNGIYTSPAKKPLKYYAMVLGCDGKLYVDKTNVAKITDRVVA